MLHWSNNLPYFELSLVPPTDWRGEFSVRVEGENTGGPSDLTLDDFVFVGCGPPVVSGECPMYHVQCPDTGESWILFTFVCCCFVFHYIMHIV